MKTISYALLMSIVIPSLLSAHVTEPQDEGYQFLKRAFCPTGNVDRDLEPGSEARQDFEEIRRNSSRNSSFSFWCWPFCKPSKKDTLNAIQGFVYEKSYDYAYNRTKDSRQAKQVAQHVRNTLQDETERYTDKYNPPYGAFRSFIGGQLHSRVADALKKAEQPPQQSFQPQAVENKNYRPSSKRANNNSSNKPGDPDECPICTDDNIPDTAIRIYPPKTHGCKLSGLYDPCCAHWICINCAAHYFVKDQQQKCPLCHQYIDVALVNKIIQMHADQLEHAATISSKESAILKSFYHTCPELRPSAPAQWW